MSEEAVAAPKKKKGKLPVILALVAILGGGGFFMTKKKGPDKAAHLVEISADEIPLEEEFLVNMSDGRTYLRTKIAVKLRKDYKAEEWAKHGLEVADAVNMALKATDPKETITEADMKRLKRRVAASINKALGPPPEAEAAATPEHGGKTTSVNLEESKDGKGTGKPKGGPEIPADWDSLEGPVIKVLFSSFATQ